jgi:hypothetical protein
MTDWKLKPGEFLTREQRRLEFGGATQGGIQPSAQTPNVFIYTDPTRGETFGYLYDGWNEDRTVFLYTGEGRNGDQRLIGGNRAILDHKKEGRRLRLFVADGFVPGSKTKNQRYIGEFEIDETTPYILAEAPNTDDPDFRSVIVFRLRPIGEVEHRTEDSSRNFEPPKDLNSTLIDDEIADVSTFDRSGTQASTANRTESALVKRYKAHLESQGHQVKRWKLAPPGEINYLFTDVFDVTENELYEAKGTAVRSSVRLAVGQLLDYRRLLPIENVRLTILLPIRPSNDLLVFIKSCGMSCVWENGNGYFERLS